jgi:hypothetical protein
LIHEQNGSNTPPRHWLDALIEEVVERNGDQLSAHQLVNAIMHAPPIVNTIQRAINERTSDGVMPTGFSAEFAREIRLAFIDVLERDAAPA